MPIQITARHFELRPEVRLHVEERVGRFDRFAGDVHGANVVFTLDKNRVNAEITVRVNQHELVASEESTDAVMAFDLAADRIEAQLRKLKEKRLDHRQAGPGTGRGAAGTAGEA